MKWLALLTALALATLVLLGCGGTGYAAGCGNAACTAPTPTIPPWPGN